MALFGFSRKWIIKYYLYYVLDRLYIKNINLIMMGRYILICSINVGNTNQYQYYKEKYLTENGWYQWNIYFFKR